MSDRSQILSRRHVEGLIANGQTIVISENRVLRLDRLLESHPGGKLAILHMVGRDATDELNIYHSAKVLKTMDCYRIGRVRAPWVNFTPPIRGGIFHKFEKHREARFVDEGLGLDTDSSSASSGDDCSTTARRRSSTGQATISSRAHADRLPTPRHGRSTSLVPSSLGISDSSLDLALDDSEAELDEPAGPLDPARLTRAEYTAFAEQSEIQADLDKYPSLDAKTQRNITLKYQQLHRDIKAAGLYDCSYASYAKEAARYSILFALFVAALRAEWYMTSAVLLGMFWHQIMFTAHDAGHMGITHDFKTDTLIGMFVADFCCGLSIGWWKSSHNVHHLVTNHPEHDPDIQNVPLLATSPSFFRSVHSSYYDFDFHWDRFADVAVRFQHYTYYPIMCIARFNLYLLSWLFLLSNKSPTMGAASWTRPTELLFMTGYWYMFGYVLVWQSIPTWTLRVAFVLLSHVITMPLHVQITLSHFAASTADLGEAESFPQKQLRTTMDVECPPWLDFIHGGLQFQAVHHLFPRVPRHNLRTVQAMVRAFCADVGIEYKILGFMDGNREVLGRLGQVAKQVEILVECQRHMAETGESGLH
ncbi:MAG: hypothetical protein M1832_004015 [Thelocarpon impressellum]|nr:MAG: hypothetical protein M1832_004015 [Thelocarpon impressellum]